MPKIVLDNLPPAEAAAIEAVMNEGKMQAYEELLEHLEREHFSAGSEDPYYAYYVKHIIELVHEKYDPLIKAVEG
jgi:hypothetical protein